MQQTVERAAANVKIAKVRAAHAAISAEADAKVLATVGTSIVATKALATGAVATGAVAATTVLNPFLSVPAGLVSVGKTTAALMSARIGLRKSALAIKEAAAVKAVSAAVAAKRIATIEAHYKAQEAAAVARLTKSGAKAAAAGASALESLSLFPRGLAAGESLGNEAIPFLLRGVLGGAATSDIFQLISRLSPEPTNLLGGLLSALRPDAGRAQNAALNAAAALDPSDDNQSSAVATSALAVNTVNVAKAAMNAAASTGAALSAVGAANAVTSAAAAGNAANAASDAKGLATTALLMAGVKAAGGPGAAVEITTKGASDDSSLPSLELQSSEDQSSAVEPMDDEEMSADADLLADDEQPLFADLTELLPVPQEMRRLPLGEALVGLLPVVVNGLGALMGGAEPVAAGLPKLPDTGLIKNLANLVPEFF